MEKTDRSLRIITKGALILLLGTLLSKVLTYLYTILIARYLGPSPYGLISLGFSIVGIFGLLAAFGIPEGLLRYIPFYKGKNDAQRIQAVISFGLKLTFILSIIFSILLYLSSTFISLNIFHDSELIPILKLFSLIIPIVILCYNFEVIIQAFRQIKYTVYSRNIGENLAKLILTILFLVLGLKLLGAVIAYILAMLIGVLLMFYFIQTKIYKIPNLFKKYPAVKKELLSYSTPLMFNNLFIFLFIWVDTIILGYLKDSSIVGIYNAAVPSARLIYIIPTVLLALYTPTLMEGYASTKEIPKLLYKTITKWIFLICLPILFLLAFFSKSFLNIFFGGIYSSGYTALIILLFGNFIYSMAFSTENNLLALKKSKVVMLNKVFSGSLNVILNFVLIPIYGINGAALATSSSLILEALLINIENFYFTRIIPYKLNYIKPVVCSILSLIIIKYLVGYFFDMASVQALLISIILFNLIYFITLFITRSFESEDMKMISLIQLKLGLNLRFLSRLIQRFR